MAKKTGEAKKPIKKKTSKKVESKEISKVEETKQVSTSIISEQAIKDYLFGSETRLTPEHQALFIQTARAFNLNPFKHEIYAVPFREKSGKLRLSIITGYEVYLKRAEATGMLSGVRVWTEGSMKNNDLKACIEITRKDFNKPFYHEVDFNEYNQNNYIWKSKPKTMIKKVAYSQGFRLAFPNELGGLPYTADELPDNMTQYQKPETTSKYNQTSEPINITPEEKLKLPDNIDTETICELWIYKENPKKYSLMTIDELLQLQKIAINPENLNVILAIKFENKIYKALEVIPNFEQKDLVDLIIDRFGTNDYNVLTTKQKIELIKALRLIYESQVKK